MDKQKVMTAWCDCELVNYSNREEIAKVYPDALFMGNEEKGDFGFITTTADSVKIVWRGSDDWLDWLSNFGIDTNSGLWKAIRSISSIFKRFINEVGYHIGFHDAMGTYINQIFKYIQASGKTKIDLRGHSRGGGNSLNIAGRLCRHNYEIHAIVFGCPKMCTKDTELYRSIERYEIEITLSGVKRVKRGNVRIDAFINGMDIVPEIPFALPWGDNLVKVGNIHRIGKRMSVLQRLKMYRDIYKLIVRRDVEGIKDVLEMNRAYTDDHKSYKKSLVEYYGE